WLQTNRKLLPSAESLGWETSHLPLVRARAAPPLAGTVYRCEKPDSSERYQSVRLSPIQPKSLKPQLIQPGSVRRWRDCNLPPSAGVTVAIHRSLLSIARSSTAAWRESAVQW